MINFTGGYGVTFGHDAADVTLQGFTIIGDAKGILLSGAKAAENSPGGANEIYDGNCVYIGGDGTDGARPVHIPIRRNYIKYCPGGGIASV